MGNCLKKQHTPTKQGDKYNKVKNQIKPFDLVLFKGGDYISDFIRYVQHLNTEIKYNKKYDVNSDQFSHVGMVVTKDILPDSSLKDGKLYIWESTMSGDLTDGVPNVLGESYLGVQLRDLDQVVKNYDANPHTQIAFASLKDEIYDEIMFTPELSNKFVKLFALYNGIRYDANLLSLYAAVNKDYRSHRDLIEETLNTENWLFCSELVALIYKNLGIFPESIDPKNVVPMDFIGFDDEDEVNENIPDVYSKLTYVRT